MTNNIPKKKPTTDELLKILHSTHSVSELNKYTENFSEQKDNLSLSEYFSTYLRLHDIHESDLIRSSQIQRNYAYQILNGTKNPGRDKVVALCLAAQMNYEEAQRALTLADLGKLYPRRKRDSIIIFALNQKLSVQQTNELLFEENETPLE